MRAIRCVNYGAPSNLTLEEMDDPSPRDGEVVIETEAAGLGYVDALFVAGTYQVKLPLPFIPGSEVAGKVVALGTSAPGDLLGKRIMALSPRGALAEKIALPAASCIPVPPNMSAEAAAGFIVSYCTALYGFENCGHLRSGETVLVLGAAGGVGMAAIDVAKAMGAKVIAAASTDEKRAAAIARGADFAIDYTNPEWRKELEPLTGRRDVDVVYDPVGGDMSEAALRCLAPGGRHLVVGFAAGAIPKIPLNLALLKRCSIVGVDWGGYIRANPADNIPLLKTLTAWISNGRINPEPTASFPLAEAPGVLQRLLDRQSIGKPVIRFAT
ncbi:NADPH:quinone oxidoreductase family protein [Parvibaculum sp.]|uniref:NADPH:quinone oxidoreductase family protein n=1 Tax=Parvibaculum sp. TaxID=2024848 RepID=UPI00272FD28D|nr:NADPH:quinone oxidoreductase family protein [Parvibaculum sp.]MDP1626959.1 NADPH:quinone oxidoreductase family protein [Parvibaculum sp.]MDP2151645.1 NADPH:quinone oxidoreductase family protein [Parvibaculum sp.]MDP3327594.1 NADPH:quinone oxidoreductase family protein [Parvibaculum sp.]